MTLIRTKSAFAAAVVASGLTLACSAEHPQQTHAAAPVARAAPKPPMSHAVSTPMPTPTSSHVAISETIRKACGIPVEDAYFAFDSSVIRQGDARVLDQVATCFETGPLKGRTMNLVGHCDPRGDAEYNMLLGDRRAQSVKDYIELRGLSGPQMQTSSRGEMDAVGYNEATWALDRRVDVMLAGSKPSVRPAPAASHAS